MKVSIIVNVINITVNRNITVDNCIKIIVLSKK